MFKSSDTAYFIHIVYSSTCSVRCSPYQQIRNMGTQTEIAAMMNFRWFCSDP